MRRAHPPVHGIIVRTIAVAAVYLTFVLHACFSAQMSWSNNKDAGYEGIRWGASLANVREKYPGISTVAQRRDPDFPKDSVVALVSYREGPVESREFVFWKERLAKVTVIYRMVDVDTEHFGKQLRDRFGPPEDVKQTEDIIDGTHVKGYMFRWNMEESIVVARGADHQYGTSFLIFYASKTARQEYNDENRKPEF